jgi:putative membrane protein insertion efficiency factor
MTWLITRLLRLYQVTISPLLGPSCRYYPSCSAYALTSVQRHGALRGSWLAARRLVRCHPWTDGGVDLVPAVGDYRWLRRCPGHDPDASTPSEDDETPQPRDAISAEGA